MPTSAEPPSPDLDDAIEAVLHQGVLSGHLPAVQVLRKSLEVSRGLSRLGVVAGPSPATPSEPRVPRQRRPRYQGPRCPHTDPLKGPCLRDPHPNTPRAHDYTHEVVSERVPTRFDARIGA